MKTYEAEISGKTVNITSANKLNEEKADTKYSSPFEDALQEVA